MEEKDMHRVRRPYSRAGMLKFFLKGSVFLFALSIVANLIGTLLNVVIPQIISFTIDSLIGGEEAGETYQTIASLFGGVEFLKANMWLIAVAIVVVALLVAATTYFRMYLNSRANQTLCRRMRDRLFSHIQRLPLKWHHANMTGDIIQRCTSDVNTVSEFISQQLTTLIRILILTVLSLVFMFVMQPVLAAIATAFVPVLLGFSILFYKVAGKHFKKCDEEEGVLSTCAQENFSGVRVVRAFGRERYERDKFEKQNVYYTGLWMRINKGLVSYWTFGDLFVSLQLLVIITIGTLFCVHGGLKVGQLTAFIFYNTMLMDPVRQLGRLISNLSKAGVSIDRIAQIMNEKEEDYGAKEALSGDIVFQDVSFSYDGEKQALSNVSFTVPEGSTLGIIGPSGGGKSSLVALLDRLYPVTRGKITIGGRDVAGISPATLRGNIGLVLQEGHLFSGTVGENIGIAAEGGTEEAVREAARIACVDENIEGFAKGYDTVVGERGVTLSGGQKQRVAIARTMLRKTPYLVFDDSLSAVDSDTDVAIRGNLAKEFGRTTAIIISHRITTVMHADNIIVLDGGRIVEEGSHAELIAREGLYRRIYDVQMSLPEDILTEVRDDD